MVPDETTIAAKTDGVDIGVPFLGLLVARCALAFLFVLIFGLGAFVAGVGFHDPDTCWLLALGRYIFEHHSLPATDPFSYTFALGAAKPFVMYQWLSEVLFFALYSIGGYTMLLFGAGLVLASAFVCIPLQAFDKFNVPRLPALMLVTLGLFAAAFHMLVRPEIFSYLLLSSWLALMLKLRQYERTSIAAQDGAETTASETGAPGSGTAGTPAKINYKMVAAFSGLMLLWCNLHSAFTLGIIALGLYCILSTLQWVVQTPRSPFPCKTAWLALFGCLLCTLVNPKGFELWVYLPSLFFSPINKFIIELRPLSLADARDGFYYPFFILALVNLIYLIKSRSKSLFSWILLFICTGYGIYCRRIIPFTSLGLVYEAAWLRAAMTKANLTGFDLVFADANERLKQWFSIDKRFFALTTALVAAGTMLVTLRIAAPSLPQSTTVFQLPSEAIAYIKEHPPSGNLFNSAQFGDVLIWHLQPGPPVFIDTRFDMYGADFCNDYRTLAFCQKGWEPLLDKYKISWVFAPDDLDLVKQLKGDAQWRKLFEGQHAVILERISDSPSSTRGGTR